MRIDAGTPIFQSARTGAQDVAATRTPVSQSEIRAALGRAYHQLNGRPASSTTLDVLTAQASLETGRGSQMYNYNFGGIKGASPTGQTAHYMTREVVAGNSVHIAQGFRAYRTLDEGAVDYVSTLQSRFGGAMTQAERGNLDGFAVSLKDAGYYTAPLAEYQSALRNFAPAGFKANQSASVDPTNAPIAASSVNFSTSDTLARVLDAVAASGDRIASPIDEE